MKLKDLPVGALVKDTGTTYNDIPLIGIIVGHNHDGQGITSFLSEKIITLKCLDAKESTNSDTNRASYGNNRYSVSNIFQWLNSDAQSWYSAQHQYDAPPTNGNVWSNYNEYDQEAGFLAGFSDKMKSALQTVNKVTVKHSVDGGGTETVSGKIHLLSTTEVGLANEGGTAEGSVYSYFSGSNNTDARRVAYPTQQAVSKSEYTHSNLATDKGWYYWLRTPNASSSTNARFVHSNGSLNAGNGAYYGIIGVRPAWFLSSELKVSDTTDSDGAYTISWVPSVKKVYIGGTDGKAKRIFPEKRIMTARFNLSDSNPSTWGTYLDDAVNMSAGSSEWDDFFGHYPCILQNGAELGKLNPNNMALYEDGTSAPITTLGKDVMICFPRRGLKIWTNNGYLYVSMTDAQSDPNFEYLAHTYKGNDCDKFYLGKYKGFVSSSALYSTSGHTPTVSQTIGTFRTYAQARGTGYEQSAFFQLTYRQAMYMLKYLGKNAQIAVGRGFVDGNSAMFGSTGYTNDKGLDWGESTGKVPMTLFGLEDFYGNLSDFIDGIKTNSSRQLLASDGDYASDSSYTAITDKTSSSNYSGYLKTCLGTSAGGFTPDVSTVGTYGSATTYFCDNMSIEPSRIALFGGGYGARDGAGVFKLDLSTYTTDYSTTRCARLMYMHTA